MKYETYTKLNAQQKEEWDFRFKDIHYPQINITYLIVLYSLLISYLMLSYIVLKEYVHVEIEVMTILVHMSKISLIIVLVWIFDYVGQIFLFAFRKYKEHKFLKRYGVK